MNKVLCIALLLTFGCILKVFSNGSGECDCTIPMSSKCFDICIFPALAKASQEDIQKFTGLTAEQSKRIYDLLSNSEQIKNFSDLKKKLPINDYNVLIKSVDTLNNETYDFFKNMSSTILDDEQSNWKSYLSFNKGSIDLLKIVDDKALENILLIDSNDFVIIREAIKNDAIMGLNELSNYFDKQTLEKIVKQLYVLDDTTIESYNVSDSLLK